MDKEISIPPIRDDGLQLEEHRQIQEAFWTFQRVCWIIFAVVCLIALLGFTGSGGLFQKQRIVFANASVEVPRVSRWAAADDLSIRFTSGSPAPEIEISQPFFDLFSIESVQPEPSESVLASSAQRMQFVAEGAPPHIVTVAIRPRDFGWARFSMTIGGDTRMVNILVLP